MTFLFLASMLINCWLLVSPSVEASSLTWGSEVDSMDSEPLPSGPGSSKKSVEASWRIRHPGATYS